MTPIVVLRHQPDAPLGAAGEALDEMAVPWLYLDAWTAAAWPAVEEAPGVIALGGEMNVDHVDEYPWLRRGRELLAQAVHARVPVLGICLGAQMLARALGAEVKPATAREVGFHPVMGTAAALTDPVLSAFAPEARVFQFHEDEFDLPDGAQLLFEGELVRNQAFRYGPNAYGVQFHLEVTEPIIANWCDETPDLNDRWGKTKAQVLNEAQLWLPAQRAACRKAMRAFATLAAGSG